MGGALEAADGFVQGKGESCGFQRSRFFILHGCNERAKELCASVLYMVVWYNLARSWDIGLH
jgi:hypothetical protein